MFRQVHTTDPSFIVPFESQHLVSRVVESEDFLGFRLHPINCLSSKNQFRLHTLTLHFFKTDSSNFEKTTPIPTPAENETPPTPIIHNIPGKY